MLISAALISFFIWLLYSLSAFALGYAVLRHYPFLQQEKSTLIGGSIALGLGLLGSMWSALILIPGGFNILTITACLIAPFLLIRHDIRPGFNFAAQTLKKLSPRDLLSGNRTITLIMIPLAIYLTIAICTTLNPLGTDARAFYFPQAKLIAYVRNFAPLAGYYEFGQIPLPAELNTAALLSYGHDFAGRMIAVNYLWACVLLIFGLTFHCTRSITAGFMAVFLLLTSNSITLLVSDGKTDLYAAMVGLFALIVFVLAPDLKFKNTVLLGLGAALAAFSKLSFLPVLVPMLGFLFAVRFVRFSGRPGIITPVLAASGIAFMVAAHFLLLVAKNWIFYGEPLAPIILLNGEESALTSQNWFSEENTKWILQTYPAVWTFGRYPMQHGVLSPMVWLALPALLLISRDQWKRPLTIPTLVFISGLLGLLAWAALYPGVVAPRYIFPALLAFIPLSAQGIAYLLEYMRPGKLPQKILMASLFVVSTTALINGLPGGKRAAELVFFGPAHSRMKTVWEAFQAAENNIGENGRILIVDWFHMPLSNKALSCLVHGQDVDLGAIESGKSTAPEYWEDLHMAGTQVIIVNTESHKGFLKQINPDVTPPWLSVSAQQINETYRMYSLTPQENAPPPKTICAVDQSGIWHPMARDPDA